MWAKCFIPALCSCYVAGVSQKWNHVEMQGQKKQHRVECRKSRCRSPNCVETVIRSAVPHHRKIGFQVIYDHSTSVPKAIYPLGSASYLFRPRDARIPFTWDDSLLNWSLDILPSASISFTIFSGSFPFMDSTNDAKLVGLFP